MINLKSKILNLPSKPGVYIFKDKKGIVLYVGKAKSLKDRVKQYFGKSDERPQIPYLLKEIDSLDYTIVNTELESLYLERTLINQYSPKYNIQLRDDKNFAFITIDYDSPIPQIGYTRNIDLKNKKNKYFGPYTSAKKIKDTLHLVRKIFSYCSAKKISKKPCFHYHLHRCPGICVGKISLAEYKKQFNKIPLFLSGKINETKKEIKTEMQKASRKKKYETAARLRDQLRALKILKQKQNVILPKKVNWDIISSSLFPSPLSLAELSEKDNKKKPSEKENFICINLFKIRQGKLIDKENFIYKSKWHDLRGRVNRAGKNLQTFILQTFLENYYLTTSDIPRTVYIEKRADNEKLVLGLLEKRSKRKIKIIVPQKGKTKKLTKLGQINAVEYLKNYLSSQAGRLDKINTALNELKKLLGLPKTPQRIEGYDISNISGTNPVGSMVVFTNGIPTKSEYRKFKIKTQAVSAEGLPKADDFAMMREILTRRLARVTPIYRPAAKPINGHAAILSNDKSWPIPDLIVIDGGRGQLNAALNVLNAKYCSLNNISIVGLAKRLEEIFIPNKSKPIILPHTSPALQLLQRLRDEAHRFGVTFHRNLRSKQAVKSRLDEIPGIGPKTKKLLKQKFGAIADIKQASFGALKKIAGEKKAKIIKMHL